MNGPHLLNQDVSIKVKAFAVIFMLILHTYLWPMWWYKCDYPYSFFFAKCCGPFNICVAIFAFCSGYAFYHIKDKSFYGSFLKLTKFYISCGIVATFGILFAFLFSDYNPASADLWNNFLPINGTADIMKYSWYTVFFGYLMLLPPLLAWIEKTKNPVLRYLLYVLLLIAINNLPECLPYYGHSRRYASVAFFAYFFAKFSLFDKGYAIIAHFQALYKVLLGVLLCVLSMFLYSYLPGILFHSLNLIGGTSWVQPGIACLSFIHTAMCIFGLLLIIHVPWPPIINEAVTGIGKHSMNIWLISALFTSKITGPMLQTYVYTKFFPYTLGAIILLCYFVSLVLTPLQKGLLSILFKRKRINTMPHS